MRLVNGDEFGFETASLLNWLLWEVTSGTETSSHIINNSSTCFIPTLQKEVVAHTFATTLIFLTSLFMKLLRDPSPQLLHSHP